MMNPFADRTNITSEEIHTLPYGCFEGKITIIEHRSEVKSVVEQLKGENLLGFDTETRPTFRRGQFHHVAMLQLSAKHHAWLFRLHKTGFTPELASILEDPSIIKCGVAIRDDLKALQKLRKFEPDGFVELAHLAKEKGLEVEGLRKLAAILLGIRISKSAQTSNWEVMRLDQKQISYAATDAWVCLEIYQKLLKHKTVHHRPAT